MTEKSKVTEEEKKKVLGVLYDEFKDTVDWDYFLLKKKMSQGLDKQKQDTQ